MANVEISLSIVLAMHEQKISLDRGVRQEIQDQNVRISTEIESVNRFSWAILTFLLAQSSDLCYRSQARRLHQNVYLAFVTLAQTPSSLHSFRYSSCGRVEAFSGMVIGVGFRQLAGQ